jgi:hypothetical protein
MATRKKQRGSVPVERPGAEPGGRHPTGPEVETGGSVEGAHGERGDTARPIGDESGADPGAVEQHAGGASGTG